MAKLELHVPRTHLQIRLKSLEALLCRHLAKLKPSAALMTQPSWEVFLAVALGFAAGHALAQNQVTQNKKDVEMLIRDMFTKRIRDFEFPTRKNAARNCEYLSSIFDASLIVRGPVLCQINGNATTRFPNLSSQDLSDLDEAGALPKSRIVESIVRDTEAVVKVQTPLGLDLTPSRVVYFLRNIDGRWRIHNMLAYQHWPIDTNREGDCKDVSGYYRFALPPRSDADLEDLPPACKALESSEIRQRSRGK
jgi:hypothetical protein